MIYTFVESSIFQFFVFVWGKLVRKLKKRIKRENIYSYICFFLFVVFFFFKTIHDNRHEGRSIKFKINVSGLNFPQNEAFYVNRKFHFENENQGR